MESYIRMPLARLRQEAAMLEKEYQMIQEKGLKLDISRGKPDAKQIDLSRGMLDVVNSSSDLYALEGSECANYGVLEGIPEARDLMAGLLDLAPDQVFVGGNSSLNLMHDVLSVAYIHGLPDSPTPWGRLPQVKFLCPSPGYDRHFNVAAHFGFELIPVPMGSDGPDMDLVEQLVAADPAVKGIWCVPQYSNPTGITYSDETVRRFAALSPAAPDFLIMWDNAYSVHHLDAGDCDCLLNLMSELEQTGRQNMVAMFTSTSKISFPGGGISAIGASKELLAHLLRHFSLQTIGYDKINQLRHARFFSKGISQLHEHMTKHAALLKPKFEAVLHTMQAELSGLEVAEWSQPKGGYFISLDTLDGCAQRTVELCKAAGVALTPAGATFPYGRDPRDRNIRIAPTYATTNEVWVAAELLCLCVRRASIERLIREYPAYPAQTA